MKYMRKMNKPTFILLIIYAVLMLVCFVFGVTDMKYMSKEECLRCPDREYVNDECRLKER